MKRAVICLTRVPIAGKTKTRLMPLLGGARCAALHTAFLQDLSQVYQSLQADLFVAYTPEDGWEQLREIFPTATAFFPQCPGGLGERMDTAIQSVLDRGYEACVLTGSDLPALQALHFERAFAALQSADLVIGPSLDGGYYLIGMKRPCPELFMNQAYGGSNVFESTCRAANKAGRTIDSVLPCGDVDTPGDLRRLWGEIEAGKVHCPHTAAFLRQLVQTMKI